jgi:(p)ppGpp synthase/HD superfamily hydrolase
MYQIGREKFEKMLQFRMSPKEMQFVMLAYKLSKYAHKNQLRDDGTRYFEHPKRVAIRLMEFGIYDYQMLVAGLLHDVPEDSFMLSFNDIELIFGERCAGMVNLLTKRDGISFEEYMNRLKEGDFGAQIVKLVDRLDNISDLDGCSEKKKERVLKETSKYFLDWHVHSLITDAIKLIMEKEWKLE